MLTLLSPLLDIVKKDISVDDLVLQTMENKGASFDFQRVEKLAGQLTENQNQTAAAYVESQISQLVKKQVEQQYKVAVDSVTVKVQAADKEGKQPIREMVIVLNRDAKSPDPGTGKEGVDIKPVEPVKVEINPAKDHRPREETVAVMGEQSPLQKEIRSSLSLSWNVPDNAVDVRWRERGGG